MERLLLVTGGLGDIGLAIARRYIAGGWQVAINDLLSAAEGARRVTEMLGSGSARYFAGNNGDPEQVAAMVDAVVRDLGVPAVAAINAGIVQPGPLLDMSPESWRSHLDANLSGAFFVAGAVARHMRGQGSGGRLLFTGSWVQDVPSRGIGAYCVSKAGLQMLARQLALELAADGIRSNVVAPGIVDAGLSARMFREGQSDRADFEKLIPLHEIQSADQVADIFWMLAQPEADYITGASILADGGMSLFNWQKK